MFSLESHFFTTNKSHHSHISHSRLKNSSKSHLKQPKKKIQKFSIEWRFNSTNSNNLIFRPNVIIVHIKRFPVSRNKNRTLCDWLDGISRKFSFIAANYLSLLMNYYFSKLCHKIFGWKISHYMIIWKKKIDLGYKTIF